MSRQSKMRSKRMMRAVVTHELDDKGKPTNKRRKGPARTLPKHGKVNRWPYDAEAPQRQRRYA